MKNHCKVDQAALVLFSGGQDSTTCLFWAKNKFKDVYALSFDFMQKHIIELEYAKKICEEYMIPHEIMDLSVLDTYKQKIVNDDAKNDKYKNFISGRNMFFLSFAALYAKQRNIQNIIVGVSQNDFQNYPDCRDTFIKSLNVTLNLAMDYEFTIYTPLIYKDKKSIWQLADELGIMDIVKNKTVTCYNGVVGDGCGGCPSCLLRNNGYIEYTKHKGAMGNGYDDK